MKNMERTLRAFAGPVNITAAEGESSGPPKFDATVYTGSALQLEGWDNPVVIDLAGATFGKSLIANLDHESKQRVGHVTGQKNDGKTLELSGVASSATPWRDEVVNSAKAGFVWQASIEASVKQTETVAKGKSVAVNGQSFLGPLYVVRASVLKGFAFVSHGADDNTSVSIAAGAALSKENRTMTEFDTFLAEQGLDSAELKEPGREWLRAQWTKDKESKEAKERAAAKHRDGTATLDEIVAQQKEVRARESQITSLAKEFIEDYPREIEAIERISRIAIEEEWDAEKFELKMRRACAMPKSRGPINLNGVHGRLTNRIIEAGVCLAGGLSNIDKHYDDQTLEAAQTQFKHGIGLDELIVIAARANGCHALSAKSDLETVLRAAFQRSDIKAFGFSTISLPNIFSNSANKFLMEGWMSVEQAWREVALKTSVRDFKTATQMSLTGAFQYEKVGPAGEIKHGDVSEVAYTNRADTYARMFAITRQDIINDDLGALTAVPRRLGRGAQLSINDRFWTVFLNNSAFFAAGNNNVSTGAGSALGTADGAAIGAAEVIFQNQTDPDGKPLGTMPKIMLVPGTLKNTAARWMGGQLVVTGANTTLPNVNVYEGRYRVVSSAYMENASYTGFSAAAWYLLADPSDMASIQIAFLNGRDTPVVDTAEADFNTLGIQMRGYLDFGVALMEKRAGVRSAGS